MASFPDAPCQRFSRYLHRPFQYIAYASAFSPGNLRSGSQVNPGLRGSDPCALNINGVGVGRSSNKLFARGAGARSILPAEGFCYGE